AVAIVIACALTAHAQVQHWSDSVALWEHTARVTDDNFIAYEKLGEGFRERGHLDAAQANYEKALTLVPTSSAGDRAIVLNGLGLVLIREAKPDEAAARFAEAVRLNPGFAEAQNNVANVLAAEGRYAEAIDH